MIAFLRLLCALSAVAIVQGCQSSTTQTGTDASLAEIKRIVEDQVSRAYIFYKSNGISGLQAYTSNCWDMTLSSDVSETYVVCGAVDATALAIDAAMVRVTGIPASSYFSKRRVEDRFILACTREGRSLSFCHGRYEYMVNIVANQLSLVLRMG